MRKIGRKARTGHQQHRLALLLGRSKIGDAASSPRHPVKRDLFTATQPSRTQLCTSTDPSVLISIGLYWCLLTPCTYKFVLGILTLLVLVLQSPNRPAPSSPSVVLHRKLMKHCRKLCCFLWRRALPIKLVYQHL